MTLLARSDQAFQRWVDTINQVCGPFSAKTLGGTFHGTIESNRSTALNWSVVEASHAELFRSACEIERSEETPFYAVFQVSGEARLRQLSEVQLTAGDIVVVDSSRPFAFGYGEGSRQISLILPRQKVSHIMRHADIRVGERIYAAAPSAQLASRLIAGAIDTQGMTLLDSESVLDAIVSLLRPSLVRQDDLHDRLFNKVKRVIDQCLADEALNPDVLAKNVGVSRRGLYRIFGERGLVVSQYIRNRRLDMCAESLKSPGEKRKLAELSKAWGFSNSSHFSTAFKERFGMSPLEFKRRARV